MMLTDSLVEEQVIQIIGPFWSAPRDSGLITGTWPILYQFFNNAARHLDLYGDNVEVDYRGYEVTVENFIRVLTGRVSPETPRSKRLLSDDRSNILVYMTGHGGNEFLKFQDAEEISSFDLADAFEQMWEKRRYHEILFMIDTCQANTMYSQIYSPNILATGSSEFGENSYSHHMDTDIGVAVIDRFTYYNLEFLEKIDMQSKATLQDLFNSYNHILIHSTPGVRNDLFRRPLEKVLVTDFFGSVQNVEITKEKYNLSVEYKNSIKPNSTTNISDKKFTSHLNRELLTAISSPQSRNFHLVHVESQPASSLPVQFLLVSGIFFGIIKWISILL